MVRLCEDNVSDTVEIGRKLSQEGSIMTERNLAIWGSRGQELMLTMDNDLQFVGFLAGLDEETVQVCLTTDASLVLLNREKVAVTKPTGRQLSELGQCELMKEVQRRISNFMNVCVRHAEQKRETRG